jgi:hypothetical protein
LASANVPDFQTTTGSPWNTWAVATIKQVEQRIYDIEGFTVRIRHGRDGRDVRSDKARIKQYRFKRALKRSKNVKEWRDERFGADYPGFVVDVLFAHGDVAHGRTLLATVREDYLEDE